MMHTTEPNMNLLVNDHLLANLYDTLDDLHTAASEGTLQTVTTLDPRELVAWLKDFVFTAQETIRELDKPARPPRRGKQSPVLRLVEKAQPDQKGA